MFPNVLLLASALMFWSDTDLKPAIETQNRAIIAALTSGDARAYANLFTSDGFVMSPGDVIRGQDRIFDSRSAVLAQVKVLSARLETISLDHNGAIAWEIGRFFYELQSPNSEKRTVSGRYLVIWEKQADGVWKIKGDVGLPDP